MKQTTKTVRSSLGTVEFSATVACLLLPMMSSVSFAGDKPGVGVSRAVQLVAGQSVKTFVVDRSVPEKKRWLQHAGFGLMFHYEVFKNHSTASFNRAIDSFNVVRFADAVESTRAAYVISPSASTGGSFVPPMQLMSGCWVSNRASGHRGETWSWRSPGNFTDAKSASSFI